MSPVLELLPFVSVLALVAIVPQRRPHLWEDAQKRALLLGAAALPALFFPTILAHLGPILLDFCAFMSLIVALYTVAGGLAFEGALGGTPKKNTALLATGVFLASFVGTTGASMLLVRPLMQANRHRRHTEHLVVFFIVLVSNVGGLLLPIGDPPLFMGYLRGVPFFWTLRLWPMWLGTSALLLGIFFGIDLFFSRGEPRGLPSKSVGLKLVGRRNLVLLVALVALVAAAPSVGIGPWLQIFLLLAITLVSFVLTPKTVHRKNDLNAQPLLEVASVFAAIFLTLPAALEILQTLAPKAQRLSPTALFWLTGLLSSILDNAPCYLTFAGLSASALGSSPDDLAVLTHSVAGENRLRAISEGAVMMGAITYIGNGPNLMVRAVAQQMGLRAPSFVGYTLWTLIVVVPVLQIMHWLTF